MTTKTAIHLDSQNVRNHSPINKEAISKSLKEFGAGRSVLIDANNIIIAGNGVYEQAQELGLPVKIIESDGRQLIVVKRTDLKTKDEKRKALAIADNRLTDLSEFDNAKLDEQLAELSDELRGLTGFTEDDIKALQAETGKGLSTEFSLDSGDKSPFKQMTFTFSDEQSDVICEAIEKAKNSPTFNSYNFLGNDNINANAIFYIVKQWNQMNN